jgi:hypothetical protein
MKQWLKTCCGLAGTAAMAMSASSARADDSVVVTTPRPVVESSSSGPNAYLFRSGLFTLGVAYIPALVVALESDRSADNRLYAPIVGPWLDLGSRGDECSGGECGNETVNKVLLVTDGVFQGLGALQILSSFIFPSRSAVTLSRDDGSTLASFSVTPASFGHGANGVMAIGQF